MHAAQTTNGTLSFTEMGPTLIHEHIYTGMPGWDLDPKSPKYVREEVISRAVDRLQELQAHGCSTIVDPCPIDLGRDVELVAEVAQRARHNIIVATGVYTENEGIPFTFKTMMSDEEILDLYVKEITDGVGSSGIKAGVIKIASGEHANNPYETRMIGIAAKASKLTGVPIVSHTHLALHGHEQLDTILENGGCANCSVIGHSGDRDDHDYQRKLAERGAFVGLDRFGLEMVLPDDVRIRNLLQLVEAGYRDNILVSHDHVICLLGRIGPMMSDMAPNWTLTRIFDYVLPQLRKLGLAERDIEHILVDNPRALFNNAAAQLSHGAGQTAEAATAAE
jgi:phosphotriesterase-related protein